MTRLTATLGSTGLAALLMVAAVQFLPARDGGTAQAAAVPAASPAAVSGDAAAWTDPPRAAALRGATVQTAALRTALSPPDVREAPAAPRAEAPRTEAPRTEAPRAEAPRADADRPLARRAVRAGRLHLRFTARPRRVAARTAPPAPVVRTASARIRGPVGDILHGLGLD